MEIEELCTKFTADLSDFRKKMETFTDDLKRASGVTDELRKEITNAMNSSCDKVKKLGKEMSSLADKQIKVSETIAATKAKFEDYRSMLSAIQEKLRTQREEMQKLIDKCHKLTTVQKKQNEFIKETDGGIEGIRKARKEITDYIHDMSGSYEELKKKIESYGGLKPFDSEVKQLNQLEADIKRATDELKHFDDQLIKIQINPEKLNTQSFSSLGKEIETLRSKIGSLKQSEMSLSAQENSLNSAMANTALKLENLKKKAAAGTESLNTMRNRLNSASKETQKSTSRFSRLSSTVGKVSRGVLSFGKSALGFLKNKLSSAGKSSTDLSHKLLNVTKSIKRIGIVALGLKLVKSIFGELKSIVSNYISSNEELNSKVEALKNSLGKALAPVIQLITGLLERLMPYVISVTNAIADMLSSLGIGAALKSTSSALDGVTNSTKELSESQKDLYGFDQITKVGDASSDSDKKSDNNASVSASQKLSNYLQKLKDLWNSSDFEGVGSTIAGSLNKVISKINALDWNGIQDKVNKTVGGITKSLNGFIRDFDWEGSAEILGKGINTVIGAINTFTINFDGKTFGKKIADFILKAIKTIDWKKAGETIHNLITGLCDSIASFFERLKEDEKESKTVSKAIVKFLEGLKLGDIIISIAKVLISIEGFLFEVVGNLTNSFMDWVFKKLGINPDGTKAVSIKTAIKAIIDGFKIENQVGSGVGSLIKKLFGSNDDNDVNLIANTEFRGKSTSVLDKLFKRHEDTKDKNVTTTLNGKENNSFSKIKASWDWIKEQGKSVTATIYGKVADTFADAKSKWDSIKEKGKTATTTIKGSVQNTFSDLKTKWDSIKESGKTALTTISGKVQNTFADVKTKWDSIKNKTNTDTIAGAVKNTFTSLKTKWDNIKNKTNTATVKGSINNAFNTAKSKWDSIKNKAVTVTANIKDNASETFKKIANNFIKFINKAIDKINSKLKVNFGGTISNIFSKLGLNISNGSYQLFSIPSIPYLETGGIISKPTVAMVGEHGKEAVMPLENNTGWITQLAHSIVSIMGSNSNSSSQGPIIIPIYIGGKHITDIVIDDVNKRTKATGNCPIKI